MMVTLVIVAIVFVNSVPGVSSMAKNNHLATQLYGVVSDIYLARKKAVTNDEPRQSRGLVG